MSLPPKNWTEYLTPEQNKKRIQMNKIEKLEQLMNAHDWDYEQSDDQSVWRAGFRRQREIDELSAQLPKAVVDELLAQYGPNPRRNDYGFEIRCHGPGDWSLTVHARRPNRYNQTEWTEVFRGPMFTFNYIQARCREICR